MLAPREQTSIRQYRNNQRTGPEPDIFPRKYPRWFVNGPWKLGGEILWRVAELGWINFDPLFDLLVVVSSRHKLFSKWHAYYFFQQLTHDTFLAAQAPLEI